jgi:hypothetical protein
MPCDQAAPFGGLANINLTENFRFYNAITVHTFAIAQQKARLCEKAGFSVPKIELWLDCLCLLLGTLKGFAKNIAK